MSVRHEYKRAEKRGHLHRSPLPSLRSNPEIICEPRICSDHSLYSATTMAKDNGKCGADCDCAAGTCANENGKCGANCDCAAGTCANENGKCGANCDCDAGTCAKE